ncbi:MAG: 6-pyruvoyltetrahydropterin/6-carboxytetrahydropterin synthase [Chthoniobacter sp.]|jgi:6-pyruvoyltetrahydropterin/6-carboxytetrahydropterin synthase|nr:6-pyruvoyltetrahydropterin/6-carboxytetrahydropterin synthase [Chthoniobacter sp.]
MPYRICKTFEIESGHMLSKHPEKCRFPHGHTRKVEFTLEADELDASDMVCDFKAIKDLMRDFLESLDHSMCINTADPKYTDFKNAYGERVIGFQDTDPTTEVMARRMHEFFTSELEKYAMSGATAYPVRAAVRILKVRLWETSSSWAEYSDPR